jgi:lysozyme family protein
MATRYQRDYQKPEIREQQTKQWPQDTKGIIRRRKSDNNRHNNGNNIPLWYLVAIVLSVVI